jgi:hypothetical protein
VLTGSLTGWGDPLVPLLDGLIWIDTRTDVRLARLAAREGERYGRAIEPGQPLHEHHRALLEWAAAYDAGTMPGRNRGRDERWIAASGLPMLRLDGCRETSALVDEARRWVRARCQAPGTAGR